MAIYTVKLIKKRTVALNTVLFHFEKPEGFLFKPGQYAGFTLIRPKEIDDKGISRRFSLLSTPKDQEIQIVTRIRSSAYKRALDNLEIGQCIKLAGPSGAFTLHSTHSLPAVFIADGVGVAPFYSMLQYHVQTDCFMPITLFFINHHFEQAPFIVELLHLAKNHPYFQLVNLIQNDRMNPTLPYPTDGRGFIHATLLKKYLNNLMQPIYYLCGSKQFIHTVHTLLHSLDIREDKIIMEDFPGYELNINNASSC